MSDNQPKHNYTKDELTIYWEPEKCAHVGTCARGMPEVFRPKERPWVQPESASAQQIADQIDQCPSGALSYEWAHQSPEATSAPATQINIAADGPMLTEGPLQITYKGKTEDIPAGKKIALCRCGASANKPYCDGAHKKAGFKD